MNKQAVPKNSMKIGKWVKFYYQSWLVNESISLMTMEERGAYFHLLALQMNNGTVPSFIPDNYNYYVVQFAASSTDIEEISNRYVTARVLNKFTPLPDDETRMFNQDLMEIMSQGQAALQYAVNKNKALDDQRKAVIEATDIEVPDFNFTPIVQKFPKRDGLKGIDEGLRLMQNSITTQQEYDMLSIAVDNYKKECFGKHKTFIKSLSNFMKDWTSYVTPEQRAKVMEAYLAGGKQEPKQAIEAPAVDPELERRRELANFRNTSEGKKTAPWANRPEEIGTDLYMEFWNGNTWSMWLAGREPQEELAEQYKGWVSRVKQAYLDATGKQLTDNIWKL